VRQIDQRQKVLRINPKAGLDRVDPTNQLVLVQGGKLHLQLIENSNRGGGVLGMSLDVFVVLAQQEVLLVAAQLEKLDEQDRVVDLTAMASSASFW
jgi:hypothetical protein